MALTYQRACKVVDAYRRLCNCTRAFKRVYYDQISINEAAGINWNEAAEFIKDDMHGNLKGYQFSREELSSAIDGIADVGAVIDAHPALLRVADPEA